MNASWINIGAEIDRDHKTFAQTLRNGLSKSRTKAMEKEKKMAARPKHARKKVKVRRGAQSARRRVVGAFSIVHQFVAIRGSAFPFADASE